MAEIGGFEVETPQEVMARIQEQIQTMRTSKDPNVVNAANSQAVISTLFGSPELRKAQRTEKALQNSLTSVIKNDDESEVEFQIRQQAAVRNNLATINPQVALQANENILKFQSQALSQRKLKAGIDESEQSLKDAIWVSKKTKQQAVMRIDKNGVATPVKFFGPEASLDEINAYVDSQNDPRAAGYDVVSGAEAMGLEDISKGTIGGTGVNNSTKKGWSDLLTKAKSQAFAITQVTKDLASAPQAVVRFSETVQTGGEIAAGISKIYDDFLNEDKDVQNGLLTKEELIESNNAIIERQAGPLIQGLRESGQDTGIVLASLNDLAYRVAKALDGNGRLSDFDVEMAMKIITGDGTGESIKELLHRRIKATHEDTALALDAADEGLVFGDVGKREAARYREQFKMANDSIDELAKALAATGKEIRGKILEAQGKKAGTQSDTGTDDAAFFDSFIN